MKKISQNFFWMSAANIVSSLANAFIFLYLARTLKAQAFGSYSYAQTWVFFLFNFIDLGLSTYGIREIAKNRNKAGEYISAVISLRFIIAMALYALSLIILSLAPQSLELKALMFSMLLLLFSTALSSEWAFQGLEKMHLVFISFLVTSSLQVFLLLTFVKGASNLLAAPASIFLGALPIAIIFLVVLRFKPKIRELNFGNLQIYLKSSLVIWSISLFAQVYNGLDIAILALFRPYQEVGYFSVARRFVSGIILFGLFLANAALPRLAHSFKNDLRKFHSVTKDFLKLAMVLGALLFIPFVFFSRQIISLSVGSIYLPANLSLKMLVWGAILVILNLPFSTGLIAAGMEKEVLKQVIACAVFSLGLNFLLIPRLGMEGAAVSFFNTEALGLVWIFWAHYQKLGKKLPL